MRASSLWTASAIPIESALLARSAYACFKRTLAAQVRTLRRADHSAWRGGRRNRDREAEGLLGNALERVSGADPVGRQDRVGRKIGHGVRIADAARMAIDPRRRLAVRLGVMSPGHSWITQDALRSNRAARRNARLWMRSSGMDLWAWPHGGHPGSAAWPVKVREIPPLDIIGRRPAAGEDNGGGQAGGRSATNVQRAGACL